MMFPTVPLYGTTAPFSQAASTAGDELSSGQ
jgi:hypothetical protein